MQGSDREGGELPLLERAFLSGLVCLLHRCTRLCRRGIKLPKRYHESGKLLEGWPGDDSGAALIQIDLWMSMFKTWKQVVCQGIIEKIAAAFCVVCASLFAPHQTGGGRCFRREGGGKEGEGTGQHFRLEERRIYRSHEDLSTIWSLWKRSCLEVSTLFFLDYKVGKHSVHSAFISFLPRQ